MTGFLTKLVPAAVLSIIIIVLVHQGRKENLRKHRGLYLIIAAFGLIFLGSLLEGLESIPFLEPFGRTLLTKLCVLGGYLLLAGGLVQGLAALENLGEATGRVQSQLAQETSERQRLEGELAASQTALENLNEAKQNFLLRISHEMRTPLNGVIGMTDLLLETKLDGHQLKMAQVIRESGFILLNLINENLDFSTMEAGKMKLEERPFNLRLKIEELIDLMAERAQAKNLEFNFKLAPDLPAEVRGDPLRLYQILFNLLGNAIKYTQAGEIFLGVRVFQEYLDRVALHFAVRDTGTGIPQECQAKVFQPFYRVDSPESRKHEGSGLGLAIAKELVEMMHGEIGVESEPGKGSTFWFIIEMAKPLGTTRTEGAAEEGPAKKLRILVAENNEVHIKNLKRHLAVLNLQADQAASGQQMLELLRGAAQRGKPYRLGLISMDLPDFNGLKLARAIKGDWNLREIKLVLLTSFADHKNVPAEPEAEIEAYLNKPVSAAKLSQCIATLLNWNQAVISDKEEAPKKYKRFPYRVLVAEDNLVNQEVVKAMLQSLGCQVDLVDTGQQAVAAVSEVSYDLVFMDCQMPEMDGYEATRAIRSLEDQDKVRARLPILALTAHAMEGDRERCLAAGMDDYLAKPVTKEDLQNALEKWLAPESSGQELRPEEASELRPEHQA
jgi:signal transduction histidine kinase/DNA-binding response OmpR family regulator